MSELLGPPHASSAGAAVGLLEDGLALLQEADVWPLRDEEVLRLRSRLEQLSSRLTATRLRFTREVDVRGAAVSAGAGTTAAWLVHHLRQHPGEAARELRLADALADRLPATSAALQGGSVSVAAAEVVAETDRALLGVATAGERAAAEALLADQAQWLTVRDLQRAALHLRHRLDPDRGHRLAAEEQHQAETRELHLSTAADGSVSGRFRLDKEAGAALRAGLDPLAAPRPAGGDEPDRRPHPRRMADALVELVDVALRSGGLPEQGGVKPQVAVTLALETLQLGRCAPAAELDFGLPLSAQAARRLACDAQVVPVVLGSAGEPLDVGRASQTVPPAIRRAVVARDRHCAFPGCDRPAQWCHAHHIRHWADGGATAVRNLVLLCPQHHRTVHHCGWEVRMAADDHPEVLPPAWVDPDRRPRRHIRHLLDGADAAHPPDPG